MKSGEYESAGIVPGGAVYLYVAMRPQHCRKAKR